MKNFSILLIPALLSASIWCSAQIPQTTTLQGQLFQASGEPIPDGDYPVTITLHNDATTQDGITVCNPCTVSFHMGVFTIVLGDSSSPLPPMDRQYWVQFSVNGQALQPRLALHSVPYAMAAPGAVPIGSIMAFAGPATSIPDGWALCDGAAMSDKSSPKLYECVRTTWGDGSNDNDPETNFNLPDLRGMFLRGTDNGVRDQYAWSRSHNAGPAPTDVDATLGTYAGTAEGFEGTPIFAKGHGKVRVNNNSRRETASTSDVQSEIESTVALRTPNASVHYIIRVR